MHRSSGLSSHANRKGRVVSHPLVLPYSPGANAVWGIGVDMANCSRVRGTREEGGGGGGGGGGENWLQLEYSVCRSHAQGSADFSRWGGRICSRLLMAQHPPHTEMHQEVLPLECQRQGQSTWACGASERYLAHPVPNGPAFRSLPHPCTVNGAEGYPLSRRTLRTQRSGQSASRAAAPAAAKLRRSRSLRNRDGTGAASAGCGPGLPPPTVRRRRCTQAQTPTKLIAILRVCLRHPPVFEYSGGACIACVLPVWLAAERSSWIYDINILQTSNELCVRT